MAKEVKSDQVPPTAPAAAASEDLSHAIEGSIERNPGEEVRSVRVYGDHYRCNWWMMDKTPGPVYLQGGRIARSRFLKATRNGDELVIEDISLKSGKVRDRTSTIGTAK